MRFLLLFHCPLPPPQCW
ncbi:hypothetical protein FQN60_010503 [Etheostoma spectabile]|uniref:Uncharacterized protein n=1 Tax=Etheostoma spectabile TaxID=54343 RepID=A0A5J5CEQ1_9PERO|nr:hypothetical protein FQN60_004482 [Etheostoma spectabile]KAA8589158.1 hypothetical protein FQN60_010503 [Etheostoma spectabile]